MLTGSPFVLLLFKTPLDDKTLDSHSDGLLQL